MDSKTFLWCKTMQFDACGLMPLSTVRWWCKEAHAKINILSPSLIHGYSQHIWSTLFHDGTHAQGPINVNAMARYSVWISFWPSASPTAGVPVRPAVACWMRNQYLSKGFACSCPPFKASQHADSALTHIWGRFMAFAGKFQECQRILFNFH